MIDATQLARRFHEAYERLAPEFGYETREDTRSFDPNSANGQLMIAVCSEILKDVQINGKLYPCPVCNELVLPRQRREKIRYQGKELEVLLSSCVCGTCGEDFVPPDLVRQNDQSYKRAKHFFDVINDHGKRSFPCWACREPVTLRQRMENDGDCPHCGSELDRKTWP